MIGMVNSGGAFNIRIFFNHRYRFGDFPWIFIFTLNIHFKATLPHLLF
ncbi:hypothetical protein EVA_12200 [gut metagenome]|uniref:Uncharacterized protein n=1 Tax=gut metagenome TaxID=749906 RepID=J9CI19_9ZZZZ